MTDYQVVYYGFVHGSTGYARAAREYILALDKAGVDVKVQPLVHQQTNQDSLFIPDETHAQRIHELIQKPVAISKKKAMIYHSQPDGLDIEEARKTYRYVIINTVWETTHIPNSWIEPSNKADAIFVPSTQNIEAFRNSGVTTPIMLAPHGSDIERFSPNNNPLPISDIRGKMTFLSVLSWQHRKAPDILLKAFWQEFRESEPVALMIKTQIGATKEAQRNAIAQLWQWKRSLGYTDSAEVIISLSDFSEENIQSLYQCADAYVLPSRGEGVGLPYIEALSSGIPVIATGWGGHMDFLTPKNSFLVDYELSPCTTKMENAIAAPFDHLFTDNMQWAEPKIESLRAQMRYAYNNQEERLEKGHQGRLDMERMTWEIAGVKMKEAIEKAMTKEEGTI